MPSHYWALDNSIIEGLSLGNMNRKYLISGASGPSSCCLCLLVKTGVNDTFECMELIYCTFSFTANTFKQCARLGPL